MQELTDRQVQVKELLDRGMGARAIAEELGITRNAVYQQIRRLRTYGVLSPGFTPTGERRIPSASPVGDIAQVASRTNGESNPANITINALVYELTRTRDELHEIVTRLAAVTR